MVYFPNANVIMTGDFYRSTGYPNIDRANGGTMNGMLAGFDAIVALGARRHEDRSRATARSWTRPRSPRTRR